MDYGRAHWLNCWTRFTTTTEKDQETLNPHTFEWEYAVAPKIFMTGSRETERSGDNIHPLTKPLGNDMNTYFIAKLFYAALAATNYVTIVTKLFSITTAHRLMTNIFRVIDIRRRRSLREIQRQPPRSLIPGKCPRC